MKPAFDAVIDCLVSVASSTLVTPYAADRDVLSKDGIQIGPGWSSQPYVFELICDSMLSELADDCNDASQDMEEK